MKDIYELYAERRAAATKSNKRKISKKLNGKAEKTNASHGYKVGDYLYTQWGCEKTYVDFFKVVGVTAKSLKIVPVKSEAVSIAKHSDHVVPTDEVDPYTIYYESDKERARGYILKRVNPCDMSVKLSTSNAYKWDGMPVRESSGYDY